MSGDLSFSADDFEKLLNDDDDTFSASFDEASTISGNEDDDGDGGNSWMKQIDVSIFQRLTTSADFDPCDILSVQNDVFVSGTAACSPKKRSLDNFYSSLSPARKYRRISEESTGRRSRKQDISLLAEDGGATKKRGSGRRHKFKDNNMPIGCISKYPKPVYSYSSLIALALMNSVTGRMQVAEIYDFICNTFPFFRTAASGWKNSIRHNLSLNKCFEKIVIEAPRHGECRKYCLWGLNKNKLDKLLAEIKKSREKHPSTAKDAYANPDDIDAVETGTKGMLKHGNGTMTNYQSVTSSTIGKIPRDTSVTSTTISETANGQKSMEALSDCSTSKTRYNQESLLNWLKNRSETAIQQSKAVVSNCRPLLYPSDIRDPFANSSDEEEQEQPIDFSTRRLRCFQNQLRSVEMTPPRRTFPAAASTPPPACFSTPVRPSPYNLESPRWSPAFSFNDHRRQLWQLQNHRTPEKAIGSSAHNDTCRSDSLTGTPERSIHDRRGGRNFATSLEFAFTASSPHNNSLIVQATEMQGQQFQPRHLCFGEVM